MVLTALPPDPILDLEPWVGQRRCTFRFLRTNAVSGEVLGEINPLRGAQLTHETGRTIKRQLTMQLGVTDTAAVNPVSDRVEPFMVFPNGTEYPLGRYMFTDASRQVFTSGKLGQMTLSDEMFMVDQPMSVGVGPQQVNNSIYSSVSKTILKVLDDMEVQPRVSIAPSDFNTTQAWGQGTSRGSILNDLAVSGDLLSPWFDNQNILRFIRVFDPGVKIPDFDYDSGNQVIAAGIAETDDLLNTPNNFLVVSNNSGDGSNDSGGSISSPVFSSFKVPDQLPYSAKNRGFLITKTETLPVVNDSQAAAIARAMAIRSQAYETVTLSTAPDPRHDSYNVIFWQGSNWLELGWAMTLVEGAPMSHTMRRAYSNVRF